MPLDNDSPDGVNRDIAEVSLQHERSDRGPIAMTAGTAKDHLAAIEALAAIERGEKPKNLPRSIIEPTRREVEIICQVLGVKPPVKWKGQAWFSKVMMSVGRSAKKQPHFCDPGKESAIAGSVVVGSFELIPRHSLVPAEAFTDPKWRIIYAVGLKIRESLDGVVCVESVNDFIAMYDLDRELQEAVDSTKTMEWRRWPEFADISLAYAPSTKPLEYCLSELAALYIKRRMAEIGERLASGELEMAQARNEFDELWHGANGASLPVAVTLGEIVDTPPEREQTLLGNRFLCRGGALLFVGPSGIGKSSASIQQDVFWANGLPAFGIAPAKPFKILVIQAEDDRGDLHEMGTGVIRGLELTDEQVMRARKNCFYVTENARTGLDFINHVVAPLLAQYRPDILRINPFQAYLDGDVKDVDKTAPFLRNGLNPLLEKFNCGLVLVHHTPKLTFRGDTKDWKASDWMYAGAGAADITNWARAALVIDPTTDSKVFKFIAAKRAARIGWADELTGEREFVRYFAHATGGNIFWRPAETQEAVKAKDAPREAKDVFALVPEEGSIEKNALISKLGGLKPPIGTNKARLFIAELIADESIFEWRISRPKTRPTIHLARYKQPEPPEPEEPPQPEPEATENRDLHGREDQP